KKRKTKSWDLKINPWKKQKTSNHLLYAPSLKFLCVNRISFPRHSFLLPLLFCSQTRILDETFALGKIHDPAFNHSPLLLCSVSPFNNIALHNLISSGNLRIHKLLVIEVEARED